MKSEMNESRRAALMIRRKEFEVRVLLPLLPEGIDGMEETRTARRVLSTSFAFLISCHLLTSFSSRALHRVKNI